MNSTWGARPAACMARRRSAANTNDPLRTAMTRRFSGFRALISFTSSALRVAIAFASKRVLILRLAITSSLRRDHVIAAHEADRNGLPAVRWRCKPRFEGENRVGCKFVSAGDRRPAVELDLLAIPDGKPQARNGNRFPRDVSDRSLDDEQGQARLGRGGRGHVLEDDPAQVYGKAEARIEPRCLGPGADDGLAPRDREPGAGGDGHEDDQSRAAARVPPRLLRPSLHGAGRRRLGPMGLAVAVRGRRALSGGLEDLGRLGGRARRPGGVQRHGTGTVGQDPGLVREHLVRTRVCDPFGATTGAAHRTPGIPEAILADVVAALALGADDDHADRGWPLRTGRRALLFSIH